VVKTRLSDLAQRATDALLSYIETSRAWIEPEAQPLLDELEALISSGGKRLRPRFCYWGHIAAGGDDSADIVEVGAALELLHTMALIHDDVMDASATRRSRASAFLALAELSAEVEHRGDPKRFGASAAILTGLLGFVLADRLFGSSRFDPELKRRASDRYDRMRANAIAGQYLDLLAAHRGKADEDTTRRIASLKSGMYSVADPLAIGALLATDDDVVVRTLDAYGLPLGEAFQLRDDVLGTFGDPVSTGKDRDGDIREGKQTVLLAKARASADDRQLEVLQQYGEITASEADLIREVMVSTGALAETEQLIEDLASQAKNALQAGSIAGEAVAPLLALADEATIRHA
jgi:geranylgeranyl diphosphate synthase, type I